ncbi:hypothetical protein D9M68_950910 [compost metagenome]
MNFGFLHAQRVPDSPTERQDMFFHARMDHSPEVPPPAPDVPTPTPSPTPPFPDAPPEGPTEVPPEVNDPPVPPEQVPIQEPPRTPGKIMAARA